MADHGLLHDLRLMNRRQLLGLLGITSLIPIIGCSDTNADGPDAATADGSGSAACNTTVPTETAGPYPGDGTNGANALALAGVVRSDIRASFGTASAVAAGEPLTVTLTINKASTCEPLVGYAVYIWHCDRDGNYSMYAAAIANENYLRGVQVTDANGQVTFTTVFPGCYSGRWPHIHFEIYPTLASASNGANKVAVSQLALPKATCDVVYATTGYSASVSNLSHVTLANDNVFSDGATLETPDIAGSVGANLTASLGVSIA